MCYVGKKWSDLATRRICPALCYRQDSGGAQHANRKRCTQVVERKELVERGKPNQPYPSRPFIGCMAESLTQLVWENRRSWNWGSQGCPRWQPLVAHPVRMLLLLLVWLSKYQNACPISLSKMHPVFLSLHVFQSNPDPVPRTNCSSSMCQCG